MNREIKFRAWHKKRKFILHWPFIVHFFDEEIRATLPDRSAIEIFPMQDVELMQFTGLKDKNGKEIYEGDIIRIANLDFVWKHGEPKHDWRILEVWWNRYTWHIHNSEIGQPLTDYDTSTLKPYEIEVIGNIYENSELLAAAAP